MTVPAFMSRDAIAWSLCGPDRMAMLASLLMAQVVQSVSPSVERLFEMGMQHIAGRSLVNSIATSLRCLVSTRVS
jgi:hypothetical protein